MSTLDAKTFKTEQNFAIRDAAPERYQVRPVSLHTFQPLRIKQGEKRK